MKSGLRMQLTLLLVLAGLCGGLFAAEPETAPEPDAPSAENGAATKKAMVYISQAGQESVMHGFRMPDRNSSGTIAVAPLIVGGFVPIAGATGDDDRKTFCLPANTAAAARRKQFPAIYENLDDEAFIQALNRIIEAPFSGKTWFDRVDIYRPEMMMSEERLLKFLKKPQWERDLPDTAFVVTNEYIFMPDYFRLWLITKVQAYEVRALSRARQAPLKAEPSHLESFAAFYDIRDHFEIPESFTDLACCPKEVADLWNRDGGKLYFATITQLAAENAKMIRHFLQQPAAEIPRGTGNAAVMALYPSKIEEPAQPAKRDKVKPDDRREHGRIMEQMNSVQRKAYMMGKDYETACAVDIIERTPDRVIARGQDSDIYYSLPGKHLKLVMQSEIDPGQAPVTNERKPGN